ncbi:MAG: DUF2306 domain-containing protein [Bacteroidota bacterium]|nr:DUF2306 domain-containing protein [Bacteroidota bacterium]
MNSRIAAAIRSWKGLLELLFWAPVITFSLLLVKNTLPYFDFSPHFIFIRERILLYSDPIWKTSFYIHIGAGIFCILTAIIQFSSYILRKRSQIHVLSSKIYVFVVLLIGAPSGLYMSFFAKGEMAERGLFIFMAVAWFVTTYKGFTMAVARKFIAHRSWMIRSYAIALTAVTFRVYYTET